MLVWQVISYREDSQTYKVYAATSRGSIILKCETALPETLDPLAFMSVDS